MKTFIIYHPESDSQWEEQSESLEKIEEKYSGKDVKIEEVEQDIFEQVEAHLAEWIDKNLYLPVKQELEGCGRQYSLGFRKESLKGEIFKEMNKLREKYVHDKLTNDEKLYFLIKLMEDMRVDWSSNCELRANKIIQLGTELNLPAVVTNAKNYIRSSNETGDWDGRYFRDSWTNGGYDDAPLPKLKTFSSELLKEINTFLNYPEYALPKEDNK